MIPVMVEPKKTDSEQTPPTPTDKPAPNKDEIGGPAGLEPTRYGDWGRNGRGSDF